MDISVIILNWNTKDLLRNCLASLSCPEAEFQLEAIVVDNSSEDGSREMVLEEFPEAILIVNPTNIGFGAGNNVAVPEAKGRYLLFLNSDTSEDAEICGFEPDNRNSRPQTSEWRRLVAVLMPEIPADRDGFFQEHVLGKTLPQKPVYKRLFDARLGSFHSIGRGLGFRSGVDDTPYSRRSNRMF